MLCNVTDCVTATQPSLIRAQSTHRIEIQEHHFPALEFDKALLTPFIQYLGGGLTVISETISARDAIA